MKSSMSRFLRPGADPEAADFATKQGVSEPGYPAHDGR